MRNLALLLEYDGSAFHGWQSQENALAVQDALRAAIAKRLGETVVLTGSSRTDAGVSAEAHVANFHSASSIPAERLPLALNSALPEGLAVRACREVPADFNARFASIGKQYSYRFFRGRVRPVLWRHLAAHVPGELNLAAMQAVLPAFCGEHDFQALMDQGSVVRRTVRTITRLTLQEEGPVLRLIVRGDGFLYHQVRILAGTILAVGQGKLDVDAIPALLAAGDRRVMGMTMPPEGLCLERVFYPEPLFGGDGRADFDL